MEDNCVFCQIVNKKAPCYLVYEDQNFIAFLDIYPRVKGHTLLIPKKHYRWVYDVANFKEYWQAALKITQAMKKVFSPYFITYVTHGLEVPHAHIHILPRQKDETAFVPPPKMIPSEKMKEIAKKLKEAVDAIK